MTTLTPPVGEAPLPGPAPALVGQLFFGVTAVAAVVCGAILLLVPPTPGTGWRDALLASVAAFAGLNGLALRFSQRASFPLHAAMFTVALLTVGLLLASSVLYGQGIHSLSLAFCGLLTCVVCAVAGPRYGLVLGTATALGLGAVAWAEAGALLPPERQATPWLAALLVQWLLLACNLAAGALISKVLAHSLSAAAERERRFHGLLRIAADWYWEQDQDFRYTHISESPAASGASGRPDRLGRKPWQLGRVGLTDEQIDAHRADLEAHRPFHNLLLRQRDAVGRPRTHSLSGEPKFDADGVFCGYWGVARDVSDEVRTQRAVTASETRYRELFTRSPSPLLLHRHGTVFDANEAAARLFGFENAAALNGFHLIDLYPAGEQRDHAAERIALLDAMPVGDGLSVADFQVRATDGRLLSVQATAVRVDTASGPANLSIYFDITARQAAESALRRSEAMLSHLFATSPDCIALTEMATGRYALVNPAFCRLTGYRADEVVGRTAAELGLWHDPRQADALLDQLARHGTVAELPAVFVAKSGALVSMLLAAGRFAMDARDYLVLNARDVTQSELTRLQHAAILQRAQIGIAFTRDRRFVQANPFFEQMFGWDAGALVGQPGDAVWPDAQSYADIGQRAAPLLASGQPFEAERTMRRRDGSEFLCRMMAQVVDPADPSRGGTIWIAEDVTERRRLDHALAAARDAAEAASRAKSAFLANTSHEIRTPLNGLIGLAQLAMREDLLDVRRQQYLAQIVDSAQSLAGIMSDILDVSKIEAGKITLEDMPFDLRAVLQAVHHAYQSLAQVKGLALLLRIDDTLPAFVRGDPVRVRQILSNYITNALKFTERGQVRIEAGATEHGTLRLAVTDTGPGVAAELQQRLFTPFSQGDSSTTRRYGGTGLGLSICHDLARLMGGRVGVRSTPGQGSTFWAELPLPSAQAALRDDSTEAVELERLHGARLLLVEDNPVNMMICAAMLEEWGVLVVQACDGRAAVAAVHRAEDEGRPFDAVLMDVQMPVMGGHDATRELRATYPSEVLPIIALTAAALVSERDDALAAGMDDFLTKPIDAAKLRLTLAQQVVRRRREPAHAVDDALGQPGR